MLDWTFVTFPFVLGNSLRILHCLLFSISSGAETLPFLQVFTVGELTVVLCQIWEPICWGAVLGHWQGGISLDHRYQIDSWKNQSVMFKRKMVRSFSLELEFWQSVCFFNLYLFSVYLFVVIDLRHSLCVLCVTAYSPLK